MPRPAASVLPFRWEPPLSRTAAPGSVIGFDDLPHSSWIDPPLTTIRQPLAQMGSAAVDVIVRVRAGRHPHPAARTELSTTLVVRSSTAPLRG
ncbi:DNA-binding LacI/PurR family transcriptional regulator [Microbacterium trichothecenolyticum]|uniref:substrate-binding domain-containing protein n=1 Tax=Microbacterium trichothecenolyticum TaxID=69370 RepID=UPI0028637243|nr:substrate-binding domain-containing protein [Microbacterium trichothecenolyticum]MDR7111490.1 DNA-binding LacI/PurR family transcriptional regulator [Microbacterium trichothecenolyticum]